MPVNHSAPMPAPARPLLDRLRRPRQRRGEQRVEAILDAAAFLIAEHGADGLTVQALADRARTSKGSLYHFFPDLPSVLCALAERHAAAITALTAALVADRSFEWSRLTLSETIDRFLSPLSYIEAHPDLLALARTPLVADNTTRRLAPIRDLATHILKQRCPALPARRLLAAASTMVALVDGVVGYSLRSDDVSATLMVAELQCVLCAYLSTLDECGIERAQTRRLEQVPDAELEERGRRRPAMQTQLDGTDDRAAADR
jgi:AcrR family transcriptional regulator